MDVIDRKLLPFLPPFLPLVLVVELEL